MDIRISFAELEKVIPIIETRGQARPCITGVSSLEDAVEGDVSFAGGVKQFPLLKSCKASVVIVPPACKEQPAEGCAFIVVGDPSLAIAKVCELFEAIQRPRPAPGVHSSATVAEDAAIGEGVYIGPNCSVAPGAKIGDGSVLEANVHIGRGASTGLSCRLHPGVVVHDYCQLGNNVILQPGVVIGGDGFGYTQVGKLPDLYHYKLPQIGIVVLEDNVEVGANSTIDRARFGKTLVGEGTKIDSLVQVGHNSRIGRRCIICAQVGIAGSTTIGDFVIIWGQAGLAGHTTVGDGAFIGGQAGVINNLPAGAKVTGTPARPVMMQRRIEALGARLPELFRVFDREQAAKASQSEQ